MNDLPLSNGVVIPAGCTIGVASYSVHRNPVFALPLEVEHIFLMADNRRYTTSLNNLTVRAS